MVYFSKREEVERWLDAIKPAQRRREVAIAMAARAALRVLPLLGRELTHRARQRDEILSAVALPCLRATGLSWAGSKYPTHRPEVSAVGDAAAVAARAAADAARAVRVAAFASAYAANAAADAANAAADTAYAADAYADGNAAAAATYDDGSTAYANAFATDAELIDSGHGGAALAGMPLWLNGAPELASEAWRSLKSALLAADQGWEVWTDWYEARLAGDAAHPPIEALEVARATIPDEIWRQGPAVVNADIKRLIDLQTPKKIVVSTAAFGVETLASVGDVVPSIVVPLQGVEARASAAEVVPNPASPPAGWMNAGDDPAVQLAARTRLQARAASETAFITQPPFPQSQVPSAGSAPQLMGGTTPPLNLPPVETIPLQERAATQFRADAQGRIDVVQIPPSSDELQRLHYDEMRHKALALVALGQMLGDLASPADRFLEALPERIEDASVDKLWSRGNTLRRRHDAHVRAIENDLGPNPARLDDLVAATLGDLADSFNVYVLGEPRALELDSARLGPQDREAVRKVVALAAPIARAASEPQSPATPAAQDALAEQVGAAIDAPSDINGDQAAELARKTTGNFVSELLRLAYAPIAKLKAFAKDQAQVATKGIVDGFYREAGRKIFDAMPGTSGAMWRTISDFVVAHAESLKDFVTAQFHNPTLIDIIDWIMNLRDRF